MGEKINYIYRCMELTPENTKWVIDLLVLISILFLLKLFWDET
jgi:hypothetical protein